MERQEKIDFIELNNITGSDYTYEFPANEPLILGDDPEIGLKSYFLWYEMPNVSSKYSNNTCRVKYNGVWKDVTILEGMYEVKQLSDFINRTIVLGRNVLALNEPEPKKILELAVDTSTFHCLVKLSPGVEIDLSEGKLHELLGLEKKIYNSSDRGKNFINITRNVDKIYIRCNLVDRKYQYDLRNVLYSILPVALPGEALTGEIDHPMEFYKCNTQFIRTINIRLTDKLGQLVHLNESLSIKIALRHHVKLQ